MTQICKLLLSLVLIVSLVSCNVGNGPLPKYTGKVNSAETDSPVTEEGASSVTDTPDEGDLSIKSESSGTILDYFAAVAFDSEFGESSRRVTRWESEIVYSVTGSPTEKDLELIGILVERLNTIEGFPGIREAGDENEVNFEIMFIPRTEIMESFEHATDACKGMSEFHWYTDDYVIYRARAAIDCDEVQERESTICEEILQSLGIAMDSFLHKDSVFYQGTCVYKRPSELDWTIVQLLYHPKMQTGMTKTDAICTAASILKW